LKECDNLWTEQGWSSSRKSPGLSRNTPPVKEAQTTSTSDSYKKSKPTKTRSRRPQTDLRKTGQFRPSSSTPLTPSVDNTHVIYNKCVQSATPRTWLQLLQRLTRKLGISHNDAQPVSNDLTAWLLNQGRLSVYFNTNEPAPS
jgi:hypothetical protein